MLHLARPRTLDERRVTAGFALALCALVWLFPSGAVADREHTVSRGQTLARIAAKYGIPVASLAAANGITDREQVRAGQVLVVPPRGVVYVAPGDTLAGLAKRYDVPKADLARQNRLDEEAQLRIGQRLLLPGFEAAKVSAAAQQRWGAPKRPGLVVLHRLGTRITRRLQLLDRRGRVPKAALRQLGALMRPRDVRRIKEPHQRLARLLARVSDHFGGRPLHIVSGVRKAGGYTRDTSRHVAGHALDFRIIGVPLEVLRDYCAKLDHVGVGYYPNSNFVHLDVRRTSARWTDLSGPGEAPRILRKGETAPEAEAERGGEPPAPDEGQAPVNEPELDLDIGADPVL